MLTLNDIHVHYGLTHVLRGVSLKVPTGEIVGLLGGNGSGKSTALNAICGIVLPSQGTVLLDEIDLPTGRPHETFELGIVQVPQGREVFKSLTAAENLELGAICRRMEKQVYHQQFERVLNYFPALSPWLKQKAGFLSGGQQQMLAIGRALMSKPTVLLLDEPCAGLAPVIIQEIISIIAELNAKEEITMLIVEQNVRVALEVCSQINLLRNGEIALSAGASTLRGNDKLIKSYFG